MAERSIAVKQTERFGELTVPEASRHLLMATVGSKRLPSVPDAAALMNPGTIKMAVRTAYTNPELIDYRGSKVDLNNTLPGVRTEFPTIIKALDAAVLEELMGFPGIKHRVAEDMADLVAIGARVTEGEVLLSNLISDGVASDKTPQDYNRVVASHNLFAVLSERLLEKQGLALSGEERDNFIAVGQALLTTRRLFEAVPGAFDEARDSIVRSPDREQDYTGRLAMIVSLQRLANLARLGGNPDQVKTLTSDSTDMIGHLQNDFPDKFRDISNVLGSMVNEGKLDRWTEQPGGPDFTPSERVSFINAE